MTARDVSQAVRDPGFTPAAGELDAVIALLAHADEKVAEAAERALARTGMNGLRRAWEATSATPAASTALRVRVLRLASRVAERANDAERVVIEGSVARAIDDEEGRVRRAAIGALAKVAGGRAEAQVLARLAASVGSDGAEVRACLSALGRIGGAAARDAVSRVSAADPETQRLRAEALLKIERTTAREARSAIDASASMPEAQGGVRVWLRCRAGLEELLAEECAEVLPDLRARAVTAGLVEGTLRGPLERLLLLRTMIRVGFPLAFARGAAGPEAAERALVDAMRSELARSILATWTRGPLRYRIEWAQAGHRRAITFRAARAIAAARPELANDPTDSPWEVVVREHGAGIDVELWPRGLDDPRFAWRTGDVPAASHPTLAAALARVAGARPDDVVWDPFVGSGSELVERARRGRFSRLIGTDLDARALAVARGNLEAAGVASATLLQADARSFEPAPRPTLILTNPPMGRRLSSFEEVERLYAELLAHAARVLADGGRIVWISPVPDRTKEMAARLGFAETFRRRLDMGGFPAAIQRFERPSPEGVSEPVRR